MVAMDDFAIAGADLVVEHSENFSPELPDQWPTPYLTKSRYLAGLQCGRRLWRLVYDPHPYEAPAPGSTFEVGEQIGLSARLLFPGGVPVLAEPWQHAEAVAQTLALM
jgi:hypothetical protein